MVKKYIRKEPPVEAAQWLGDNWEEIRLWVETHNESKFHPLYRWGESSSNSVIFVRNESGETVANIGDWVVRSSFGEYSVHKNYAFLREFSEKEQGETFQMEDGL